MDLGFLDFFPSVWLHDVVVKSREVDRRGNPLPDADHVISGCLIEISETGEFDNLNQDTTVRGKIHMPNGSAVSSSSQIITPQHSPVPGLWRVVGEPIRWPMATEVRVELEVGHEQL